MNTLQVIETAYRGTLEEQDDPVVWLTRAMRNAGAELAVLLRGNAVNYAVKGQDCSGLSIGDVAQTQPPQPAGELGALLAQGVPVYFVDEDLAARGITRDELIDGVTAVAASGLAPLFGRYERIWHW